MLIGAEDKIAPPSVSDARSRVEPGPVVPGFQNAVDIATPNSPLYTVEDGDYATPNRKNSQMRRVQLQRPKCDGISMGQGWNDTEHKEIRLQTG
jgi:hypothetical protein